MIKIYDDLWHLTWAKICYQNKNYSPFKRVLVDQRLTCPCAGTPAKNICLTLLCVRNALYIFLRGMRGHYA